MSNHQDKCDTQLKSTKVLTHQNRYKIGREIGSGTFGKVFQAIDLNTGQTVAIKQAHQDKKYKNRQLDVISKIQNSNIINVKDYYFTQVKQEKYLYIVMDIYESNLQNIFKQNRRQKKRIQNIQIKVMAFQLFKALYYLQKLKICHRDLKPPNILVNPSTLDIRICDFGSAKIFNIIEKNVTYICSRYYRAPELLFEYCMYGTQIDVWSVGCILVQFLTHQPIFPGDSTIQQLIQIIKVLGVPSQQYMQKYASYYRQQLNLPPIPATKWQKVLRKYNPQKEFIDLISSILTYDVQKRLKPIDALLHPYFHNLTSALYKQTTEKLPNLFRFEQLQNFNNKGQIAQLRDQYERIRNFKQGTSIEKCLQNHSKLQTGDCTPSLDNLGNQTSLQQKATYMYSTKSTIKSNKSLQDK